MRQRVHLIAAAIALLCGTSHAATVLKTVTRDLGNNSQSVTTVYAQGGKMRVETGGAQDNYVLFANDALNNVNPSERSYIVIDRESMKSMAATLNPMLQQMQERMKNMTPEQRAQMERMMGPEMAAAMGGGKPPAEQIRKTGKSDKIAGYNCSYAEVLRDGTVVREVCVTPLNALQGGQELAKASAQVGTLLEEVLKEVNAPMLRQMASQQLDNYDKLGGVPVFARMFKDGKPTREATLQSIATQTVPASLFEVPAGFTRKEMMPQR